MSAAREVVLTEAPDEVRLGVRQTLPVVVLRTARIVNAAGMPFAETAVLTAVDLEENRTYARLAIPPPERNAEVEDFGNSEPLQDGMIGESFVIEAREVLELPWKPTRYLLTLLMRDKPGVRMLATLRTPDGEYKDPEVEKFREKERNQPNVPPVWPAPHPRHAVYERGADSPQLPAAAGIALAAPRLLVMEECADCILRASFRLPVLRKHIVPAPGTPGGEKIREQFKGQAKIPTAVVPITLVLTGSKAAVPMVVPLVVPTFDAVPATEGGLVTGSFAIDLQQLQNVKGVDQTLFVYAFSGEVMSGPAPIAFVNR